MKSDVAGFKPVDPEWSYYKIDEPNMRFKVKEHNGKYFVYDSHSESAEPEECESLNEAIAKAASKSFDQGEQSGKRHPEAE